MNRYFEKKKVNLLRVTIKQVSIQIQILMGITWRSDLQLMLQTVDNSLRVGHS